MVPVPLQSSSSASSSATSNLSSSSPTSFRQILSRIENTLHPNVSKILWTSASKASAAATVRTTNTTTTMATTSDEEYEEEEIEGSNGGDGGGGGRVLALSDGIVTGNVFHENNLNFDPTSLRGYQKYVQHYNRLVSIQDELLNHPCLYNIDIQSMMIMMASPTTATQTLYTTTAASNNAKKVDNDDQNANKQPLLQQQENNLILARLTLNAYKVLDIEIDRIDKLLYQTRKSLPLLSRKQQQSEQKLS